MGNIETKIIVEPGKREIVIEREFNVPRDMVFRAYTDPDLFTQWIGPRNLTTKIETFEPRNGGSWRYIATDENGSEFAFHGVNHEVLPPERIIQTNEFEGLPEAGHVSLDTARFEEIAGDRTKVTSQSVFQSVADRDGMVQSDMESGPKESYDRLDELLDRMKVELKTR
jgi:uncharacterized protein YndB with AHSA1/START domain